MRLVHAFGCLTGLLVAAGFSSASAETFRPQCDLFLNGADVGRLASVELVETKGKPVSVTIKAGAGMSQGVLSWIFTSITTPSRVPISLGVLNAAGKPSRTLKLNDPQITAITLPELKAGSKTPTEFTISLTASSISRTNGVPHRASTSSGPPYRGEPARPWSGSKFTLSVPGFSAAGLVSIGPVKFLPPGRAGLSRPEVPLRFEGDADVASDWIAASHGSSPISRARITSLCDDGKTVHFDLNLYQVEVASVSSAKDANRTVVTVHLRFGNLGVLVGQ